MGSRPGLHWSSLPMACVCGLMLRSRIHMLPFFGKFPIEPCWHYLSLFVVDGVWGSVPSFSALGSDSDLWDHTLNTT